LKNLEVGYTLPASFTKKLAISNAQIYFSGMNLITITKVKDFDPESVSGTAYPLNKVYNLGLSLTF
jgi:hypothetical protein